MLLDDFLIHVSTDVATAMAQIKVGEKITFLEIFPISDFTNGINKY